MIRNFIDIILNLIGVNIGKSEDRNKHRGLRILALILLSIVYILSILTLGASAMFNMELPVIARLITGAIALWLLFYYIKIIRNFKNPR